MCFAVCAVVNEHVSQHSAPENMFMISCSTVDRECFDVMELQRIYSSIKVQWEYKNVYRVRGNFRPWSGKRNVFSISLWWFDVCVCVVLFCTKTSIETSWLSLYLYSIWRARFFLRIGSFWPHLYVLNTIRLRYVVYTFVMQIIVYAVLYYAFIRQNKLMSRD